VVWCGVARVDQSWPSTNTLSISIGIGCMPLVDALVDHPKPVLTILEYIGAISISISMPIFGEAGFEIPMRGATFPEFGFRRF
jgi:hypothetical protein